MEMTEPVRAAVQSAVLCWLATADADGRPSVSPKEIFAVAGDDIVIAHIASPRSVRNIAGNPQVCLSVLDVFEQRGYRIAGRASVVTPDHDAFPTVVAPLRELAGAAFPIKAVIRVAVQDVERLSAPSLWMYPDVDPAQRRAGVLEAYGVVDAPSPG